MARKKQKDKFNLALAKWLAPLTKGSPRSHLADHCGVAPSSVYQWENAHNGISLSRFVDVCGHFEFDAGKELNRIIKIYNKIIKEQKNGTTKPAKKKTKI